jgi:hypothetical protein
MSSARQTGRRRSSLPLAAAVAVASAGLAFAFAGGHAAQGHSEEHADAAKPRVLTQEHLALHDGMRRLWEDHITWTRLAIISLTGDTPDSEASVGRLLQNQTDIGDAIKPFYGEAAGQELTRLLRDHILIAADLVAAARAGDEPAIAEAQSRWTANADEIAAFLASANPRSWDLDEMKTMLHEHLRLTANEAIARIRGDWAADVAAYDQIHLQALGMADMLSNGIVKQFPARFH